MALEGELRGYCGIQRVRERYKRLLEITGGYKGLQAIPKGGHKSLQRVTKGYTGLEGVRGG